MSRTCAAIPNGPGSSLLPPRPRRSTAASDATSPSAPAVASHERLVDVMPWIASTTGASARSLPSREVASAPPVTGMSARSRKLVMHERQGRVAAGAGHPDQQPDDRATENDVGIYVHVVLAPVARACAVGCAVGVDRCRRIAGE